MNKKRRSNFRNQTVSDAKRQKREASSYGYLNLPKGMKILNLKEKTRDILLDFIPYVVTDAHHPDRDVDENRAIVDALWYKRPFKVHRNVGSDNETVVCLTSVKKKCPICEWVADQRRKGEDWEDLKDHAAKDRNLYAVLPIDSKDHDEVVHVWDISKFLFQEELNDQLEEDPDNGVFPDLEEGLTLKVKFRWEKFGKNTFARTRDIEFEERDQQYTEDILKDVPNLDEILNVLSYKELDDKFLEMEGEDENEEVVDLDKDDKPERTSRRRETTRTEPKDEHEKEEEKHEKEKRKDKSTHRTRREHKEEESSSKNKCPVGHKFGTDCEKHDECDECDKWDDCIEAQEKQE